MSQEFQELLLEMSQWHHNFMVTHNYGNVKLTPDQIEHLEKEWKTRTHYIPNDTFVFGVPFYSLQESMKVAGVEKFFGKREMTVLDFIQFVHPRILGSYLLMGQASYQLASRPEYKEHAMKGSYSSKLELAIRHHANNKYYSVIQYSEPILFDENSNLLYHINSYRIGNELSVKELNRYMAQIIFGPVERHDTYSQMVIEEAGKILWSKMDEKDHAVVMACIEGFENQKKLKTAEVAEMTGYSTRTITSVNERLLKIGNMYLPFKEFTTAQRFINFAFEQGFFRKEMFVSHQ
ncbi:MAG: hypothetical protein MRZ79_06840 [Bacteroidia bacterium]|nr:hypothetical protein [Bacteroidia bacterium]